MTLADDDPTEGPEAAAQGGAVAACLVADPSSLGGAAARRDGEQAEGQDRELGALEAKLAAVRLSSDGSCSVAPAQDAVMEGEGLDAQDPGPILVVADLHGNLALLKRALRRGAELAGREDLTVVLLGDYCDNGPEVRELLDFLADVADAGGRYQGMTLRPIIGNHDFICLLALVPGVFGTKGSANGFWHFWHKFWNGWEVSTPGNYGSQDSVASFRARFPTRHRQFLQGLPWYERIDGYIFVHAGLSQRVPVDEQLRYLDARDLSRLHASGYNAWKEGVTGMPDQITNKQWALTNSVSWNCIVVTGHNKYASERDFVASNRLGLHSCACERVWNPQLPLHCALLKRGARDLTLAEDAPTRFEVR